MVVRLFYYDGPLGLRLVAVSKLRGSMFEIESVVGFIEY